MAKHLKGELEWSEERKREIRESLARYYMIEGRD
jgi:hypothetical protein